MIPPDFGVGTDTFKVCSPDTIDPCQWRGMSEVITEAQVIATRELKVSTYRVPSVDRVIWA
jgi:hypothetical protein